MAITLHTHNGLSPFQAQRGFRDSGPLVRFGVVPGRDQTAMGHGIARVVSVFSMDPDVWHTRR